MKGMLIGSAVLAVALMARAADPKETAVVVCGHPDDLISCAGAALVLSQRFEMHVIDLTHGERGLGEAHYRDGSCKALRIKEEERACGILGAELHWLDEIDGEARAGKEAVAGFAQLFKRLRPRVVLMPWPVNTHCDHTMAMAAAWSALLEAGLRSPSCAYREGSRPTEVYFYEQTTQTRSFRPTTFVDITKVKAKKDDLILSYACQQPEMLKEQRTRDAIFWGMRCGVPYAESYVACDGLVRGNGVFAELGAQR